MEEELEEREEELGEEALEDETALEEETPEEVTALEERANPPLPEEDEESELEARLLSAAQALNKRAALNKKKECHFFMIVYPSLVR